MTVMNFLDFSNEILEEIFLCKEISEVELGRLCCTCSRLNHVISNTELWRSKLFQKWSVWLVPPQEDFNSVFKRQNQSDNFVLNEMKKVTLEAFPLPSIPVESIQDFCNAHKDFMIWESLMNIIKENSNKRLDQVYYAKKIFNHLYSHKIKIRLAEVAASKGENDGYFELEKGAWILAQWITFISTDVHFDQIDVSYFNEVPLDFQFEKVPNVGYFKDVLAYEKMVDIISSFNKVFFKTHNLQDLSWFGVKDTPFSESPIFICYLYLTFAKNIGIKFKMVTIPEYCILKYTTSDGIIMYIDVLRNGRILNEDQCKQYFFSNIDENSDRYLVADNKLQVFCGIIRHSLNFVTRPGQISGRGFVTTQLLLEMLVHLNSEEDANRLFLTRLYLHQGVNKKEAVKHLTYLLSKAEEHDQLLTTLMAKTKASIEEDESKKANPIVKRRSAPENQKVGFRIGMIMRHRRFNYDCVIFGWDNFCDMSLQWQRDMGVFDLPSRGQQPFYNVLANDGSTRYASQESLMIHPGPVPNIDHKEIGRFFRLKDGNRYQAIDPLLEVYPEDYL